ncbi:MAG TPA: hypothetical protein VM537_03830 [Anaerolineae bacterium]|nr:hypothetical protein [Anaerolineae bacterium]
MAGTVTDIGTTQVWLKRRLSDAWVLHPALDPAGMIMSTAGMVTDLLLHQSYAPGVPEGRRDNLHKCWVKVVYIPVDDDPVVLWVGNIEDARDAEDEQAIKWVANSLEAQLRKIQLTHSYGQGAQWLAEYGPCSRISGLRFNEYMERSGAEARGRRSILSYHFGEDGGAAAFSHAGVDDVDAAYVFGDVQDWSVLDILRALLAWYAPAGQTPAFETPYGGRKESSPVGFKLGLTTTAQTYLGNAKEAYDLTGMTLLGAITYLVERAGPLFWWLDWGLWENGTQEYVLLRVASREWSDEVAQHAGAENVALADCMPIVMRARVKDRAEQVIARGAPIKVMFSASQAWNLSYQPVLSKGWTTSQQDDWLENGYWADDLGAAADTWDDVFLTYTIPEDKTWQEGGKFGYAWHNSILLPDPQHEGARILEHGPSGWPGVLAYRGGYIARARPLLPYNLMWKGFTNPTDNTGVLPTPIDALQGTPEHESILAWRWVFMATEDDPVVQLTSVRRLSQRAGIQFGKKAYRDEEPPFLAEDTEDGLYSRWHDLWVTVSVETDNFLEARACLSGQWHDDQRRTAIVDVPDAEWWAAARYTIASIDVAGRMAYMWGVLRNDYPRLKDLAEQRLKFLDQRVPRYHGTITYKTLQPSLRVGHWIGTYGQYPVHTPVMSIAHELMDLDEWGTQATTFQPMSMEDTP